MTVKLDFESAFLALTGHRPLQWQRRLFGRLYSDTDIPQVCDLPTGLGKTSVIPIFVIALACQAEHGAVSLPRRLVYVVNRRTVVDQATSIVEEIHKRLLTLDDESGSKHRETLKILAQALRGLSSTDDELLLAVSTLRGELADNEQWKADPARPSIVIGTIDMIGSKLLFSGYGDGRYLRPHHAGLVGHDSLIVHDESHLTPAFSELLRQLESHQSQDGELKPVRVMELSATVRNGASSILRLEDEDKADQIVKDRLDAVKLLHLDKVTAAAGEKDRDVRKKVLDAIVARSLKYDNDNQRVKVLIYVRSPEDANEVSEKLQAALDDVNGRVQILTGTIRGYERDRLVQTPVFQAFLTPDSTVEKTIYLVSTSAGEVGIDIDADHMVCDLTTLDSLIQRLGRVNRRGGKGKEANINVVVLHQESQHKNGKDEFQQAINATQMILDDWTRNRDEIEVSPRNLKVLVESLNAERKEKAFAPRPIAPVLTDILLDAWSLTSITTHMPGRPEVAGYLHGLERDEIPETYIVWRKEVKLLDEAGASESMLGEWFEWCRIESRERLRDRVDRAKRSLASLLERHREKVKERDFPVVLMNERGETRWHKLSKIVEKNFSISYTTIILPTEIGGLKQSGTLDGELAIEADNQDVAEEVPAEGQRRERWLTSASGEDYRRLVTGETSEALPTGTREVGRLMLEEPVEDTGEGGRYLILVAERKQQPGTAMVHQPLDAHSRGIAGQISHICEAMKVDRDLEEALVRAAEWHDRGKARAIWQAYARNENKAVPLAKSTQYGNGRELGGYRHEFGSLLEAAEDTGIRDHTEADLILHLIAAHHGWARPHFEYRAWDNTRSTDENEKSAIEAMRRFDRLQQRFGRWGLAWLESLLRCADIAVSNMDESNSAGPITKSEVKK